MLFFRIFGKCLVSLCGEALAMCFLRVRFLVKSKSRFRNPKTDFAFFWTNPKTDHESIKSTLRVDYSDFRIFEIHNLSGFLGKDLKLKVLLNFDKRFFEKKIGTQQMPYMYDF